MTRVAKVSIENWDPELVAMTRADENTPLEQGLMRMFANAPEVAKAIVQFIFAMKQARTLSPRLVELVRLRIAFHNQCRSCMAVRYPDAIEDGLTEDLVCSLERPAQADNLTEAEKAAIDYGERFATNHLSIDDAVYDRLREHFSEAQIVELGTTVAYFVGFGRLGATWNMIEELPKTFQGRDEVIVPWRQEVIVVNRNRGAR